MAAGRAAPPGGSAAAAAVGRAAGLTGVELFVDNEIFAAVPAWWAAGAGARADGIPLRGPCGRLDHPAVRPGGRNERKISVNIDLSDKTAIVTGSTGGIGLAIAEGLARAGARVVIVGRSRDTVDAAVAKLKAAAQRGDPRGVVADVGTAAGCEALVAAAPDADILVNNLGIYGEKEFFAIDDANWEEIFQVNVMSGVRLSRHYAPGMRKRGWGRIQFISSESALNIPVEMVHYGASKAAMQAIARGLAKALAGSGVTVNSILPGPTRSEGAVEMMRRLAAERGVDVREMEAIFLRENRPSNVLGRFAEPEEVAAMSVYIASPQASATTGAALRVDGGTVESIA